MTNATPNLHTLDSGQCFPLKIFKQKKGINISQRSLLDESVNNHENEFYEVEDGITDETKIYFSDYYSADISKEDIFYYIYGLLHSIDYREKFNDNLSKEKPSLAPSSIDFDEDETPEAR